MPHACGVSRAKRQSTAATSQLWKNPGDLLEIVSGVLRFVEAWIDGHHLVVTPGRGDEVFARFVQVIEIPIDVAEHEIGDRIVRRIPKGTLTIFAGPLKAKVALAEQVVSPIAMDTFAD